MLGRKTREDRAHRQRTLAEQRRDRDVLGQRDAIGMVEGDDSQLAPDGNRTMLNACTLSGDSVHIRRGQIGSAASTAATRSEEHTSELKSLMRTTYAVICLKKKKNH